MLAAHLTWPFLQGLTIFKNFERRMKGRRWLLDPNSPKEFETSGEH
jgi:hypothetical protein